MRRRGCAYSYHFVALIKHNASIKCRIHRSGCNQDHEPGFKSTQVACESRGKKAEKSIPRTKGRRTLSLPKTTDSTEAIVPSKN